MKKNLMILSFLSLPLASCSYPMGLVGLNPTTDNSSANSPNDASSLTPTELEASSLKIMAENCSSCHGTNSGSADVYGLANINHLIAAGLIAPGNPSQSLIFEEVEGGDMPPEHPLDAADREILRLWILGMNSSSPAPAPAPSPVPSPAPSATPAPPVGPQPTYSYIQKNILASSCVACHSAKNSRGGVALDTYASVLKTVNKKSPAKSLLYRETQSGSMPPRPRKVLNSDQLRLILTWIEQGALNN